MDLTGAHVLVTGASRGVGRGLAERFAAAGARVTLVARSEGDLRAAADAIGGEALPGDLTDPGFLRTVVAEAERRRGPLDVLVNNAGVDEAGVFDAMDADTLERVVRLNLLAALELTRQALPGMRARRRGHVVNISSLAGVAAVPGIVPYAATKAGLSHATAALRLDLRGTGVNTTLVQAGVVDDTVLTDSVMGHEPFARGWNRFRRLGMVANTPLGTLCDAVVRAVQHDRRHVRLPRRSAPLMMLPEAARRVTEVFQTGLPTGLEDRGD